MRTCPVARSGLACLILAAAPPALAHAESADAPNAGAIIVTAPGIASEPAPGSVDASAVRAAGRPDMLEALARAQPGLSLQQAQGNPFQPNLAYHGFVLSPLQGQPQGLAAYVDGARFNQPFGDTVQFDLLPEAAIARVDLLAASPAYGLNALGGALVVETKTGRSAPGLFLSGSAGRFGEAEGAAEAGWSGEHASAYVALQESHDGGWRRFSPSALHNGFADLGWDAAGGGIHAKLIAADSDLTGNGSAPVELLDADYRGVFTHPDATRNRFLRLSLHPWLQVTENTRIETSLYHLRFRQRTLNGDAADIEECEDDDDLLCLSAADDEAEPLRGEDGSTVDALGDDPAYGVLNRSRTRTNASGVLAQLADTRPLLAGENRLTLGFSYDVSRTGFASSSELGTLTEDRGVTGQGAIIAQPDGAITPVSLTARTRYLGLFVAERLPLAPTLTLGFDLRYNRAAVTLVDRIGDDLDGSHRFRRLNPGASLRWAPRAGLSFEAGYAETNRAPTPAELACADAEAPCSLTNFFVADPPLEQVVARSITLAAKAERSAFQAQLLAYRTVNSDDIQFVASDVRGRAFFRNIGKTRRQGIDLNIRYHVNGLTLRGGYAFADATFRTPLLLNSPDNPSADDNGQIAVARGDELPGIPRHRFVLAADYETEDWSLGADLQVASGQHLFGDEANLEPRTTGYALVNLRGSLRLAGAIQAFAEVRNLFGKRYATFGAFSATDEVELDEAPGATDPRSLGPGAPRRWVAGLRASF